MNIVKPSLSLMPMEDIASELRTNKPNRNFMTKEDNARDVENVAGVRAELIAQAVSAEDRTTVNNALNLGGKPASEYIDKSQGEKILDVSDSITKVFSDEVRDLRDEMYQIKSALNKSGFMFDVKEYKGYTDSFKRGDEKYTGYICKPDKAIIGDTRDLFISDISKIHHFERGKKFIIRELSTNIDRVVTSTGVTASGRVSFIPSVRCLDNPDNIDILKTNGSYIGGSFSFSDIKKNVVSQKEMYHMQSDDTYIVDMPITKSRSGFAVFFKVPDKTVGALSKFEITASSEGTPGDLLCHVLSKDAIFDGDLFIPKFTSILDAKEKGYLIATSKPVKPLKDNKSKDISFDFSTSVNGAHPFLTKDGGTGRQYLFIVECTSASENDLWKIRFSHHKNELSEIMDLQRNNKSFLYNEIFESSSEDDKAITVNEDLNNNDMIFTLTTKEILNESEIGRNEGVYTANITLTDNMDVSTSRVTLRINREACYYVETLDSSYTTFTIAKESPTSYSITDTRFKEGDKIIVGNQICTVKRVSGNLIELKEPCYIDPRISKMYKRKHITEDGNDYEVVTKIPVYRLCYEVYIKPYAINWNEWDENEGRFKTVELSEEPIPLKLVAVAPDNNCEDQRVSDRLIFEADFGENEAQIANLANELELQVYWKSPYSENEINSFMDIGDRNFKELIGRIHTVNVSLNKSY